jgi:uncharacterized protein YqeY
MTPPGHDNLRDRLRQALPPAMKARDRPAVTALRSALAAIDNAGAVDPAHAPPTAQAPPDRGLPDRGLPDQALRDQALRDQDPPDQDPPDQDPPVASSVARPQASAGAAQPRFAGTVAGVGATEVERRSLSQAQMEAIVRTEIADRETAAAGYERAGQLDRAERLRAEAEVLLAHLNTT